jgi:predicted  nucleic acid-binding Zn-ribbon protein
MPNDLGAFFQTALAVLTLASLAGLGLMRGVVTGLRESLKDSRERITDLEKGRVEDRATIESQKHEIASLRRIVTGEDQLREIADKLDSHHEEAKTHWETDEELLGMLLQVLSGRKPTGGKP